MNQKSLGVFFFVFFFFSYKLENLYKVPFFFPIHNPISKWLPPLDTCREQGAIIEFVVWEE